MERPTFGCWVSLNCFLMLVIGFIGTVHVRRLGSVFPVSFLQGVCIEIAVICALLVVGSFLYQRDEQSVPLIASIGALAGLVTGIALVLYMTPLEKLLFPTGRSQHSDEVTKYAASVVSALMGVFALVGILLLILGLRSVVCRLPQRKYHNLLASLMLVVEWMGLGLSLLILVG